MHRAPQALGAALRVLRRHWRSAYLAAAVATLANTVPDVGRQLLVWDDPSAAHAALVDVVGVLTAAVAQLWVTGAVAALPGGGGLQPRGALGRGTALARAALRTAPHVVLAGLAVGGAASALVTLPASVAALGWQQVLGPLGAPGVGAFTVATVSDVVASALTLPFLALVLVVVAGRSRAGSPVGGPPGGGSGRPAGGSSRS